MSESVDLITESYLSCSSAVINEGNPYRERYRRGLKGFTYGNDPSHCSADTNESLQCISPCGDIHKYRNKGQHELFEFCFIASHFKTIQKLSELFNRNQSSFWCSLFKWLNEGDVSVNEPPIK